MTQLLRYVVECVILVLIELVVEFVTYLLDWTNWPASQQGT